MRPPVDMELKRAIGKRVKEIRKAAGLTQKAFGDSLSVSRVHINNIENQDHKMMPSESLMYKICGIYNIDFDWLKTGEGQRELRSKSESLNKFLETDRILLEQTVDYFKLRSTSLLQDIQKEENDMPQYFKFYNSAMNLILEISEDMKRTKKGPLTEEEISLYTERFKEVLKC